MFCRWCGGSIASSDTKCRRCGKDVPALSNCGGFYDLVPSAKKAANAQPELAETTAKTMSKSRQPEPVRDAAPARNNENGRKSLTVFAVLKTVGFVLALLLLVLSFFKVLNCASEIKGLRNDIRVMAAKIDSLSATEKSVEKEAGKTEPTATEPAAAAPEETEPAATEAEEAVETNPETASEPVLAEQNVNFTAKINGTIDAQSVDADLDLGEYSDTALILYSVDEDAKAIDSISYNLKEAGAAVVLTMDCDNEFNTRNLSVSFSIDDIAYGFSDTPETCKWQYRFGSDAVWEDIPDAFTQTEGIDETGLSIAEARLQELSADKEGKLELRCEILRTNIREGSLTIIIEGLGFYEEAEFAEYAVG